MRPVVIVLHQLGYGGATKAVLDQARMFTDAGAPVTITTFEHDPGLDARVAELREEKTLPAGVEVFNIHQDALQNALPSSRSTGMRQRLQQFMDRVATRAPSSVVEPERLVEAGRDKHGAYRRLFGRDGEVLAFERLRADGSVKHTNYFENRVLVRRDEGFGDSVHRRVWYDDAGSPNREQYLTPDGFCYAQRWLNPKNGRGVGVFVSDRYKGTVQRFEGLPSWHGEWLQSIVDHCELAPYVIGQSASVIPKIMGLRPDSAIRMAMMHNSHVTTPFAEDSPLRPDYMSTFERLDELDAYVVLSERQRADMVARVGGDDVMAVVPNVVEVPKQRSIERDPRLVAIVSRLAPQKALHEAIEAFALVLKQVPDARLEIYGQGPQRNSLEELIAARSLGSHVILKGRTKAPLQVMANSVCTVSTSEWEALPLSIAESLAVGTPVVAYDCLYGPSTLIRDGETGHLVPRGGREALADAIVGLLRDPIRSEEMGRAARARIHVTLGPGPVVEKWKEAFVLAESRHRLRNGLADSPLPGTTQVRAAREADGVSSRSS